MPNVAYEAQWQSQRLNKSFQQELERMKQEVYYEGLQVEEEGLTDIVRKKTKLHGTHFAESQQVAIHGKSGGDVGVDTAETTPSKEPHKNDVQVVVNWFLIALEFKYK